MEFVTVSVIGNYKNQNVLIASSKNISLLSDLSKKGLSFVLSKSLQNVNSQGEYYLLEVNNKNEFNEIANCLRKEATKIR